MSVVHSILLYGAEVWAETLDVEFHRKKPGSPTTLRTEDCMFVSNGVGGGGISDCGDYTHQNNGETKKVSL